MRKKKSQLKRTFRFHTKDGHEDFDISKVTAIMIPDFDSIHLDRLSDGTYRLIYGKGLIEDFSQIESIEMVREDALEIQKEQLVVRADNPLETAKLLGFSEKEAQEMLDRVLRNER